MGRVRVPGRYRTPMSRVARRKAQRRAGRKPAASIAVPWIVVAIVLAIAAIAIGSRLLAPQPSSVVEMDLRGVVVDQLSPEDPNDSLRSAVRGDMQAFGLSVTEYEGDEVTVETYRSLGNARPSVLLIRSHSGLLTLEGEEDQHITALFTNEPYSKTKYVTEQLHDRVLIVRRHEQDENLKFGVSPLFILQSMEENLSGTVVIIAGCSCLGRTDLADAFLARGASVVLSWDESVSLGYLDLATEHLMDALLAQEMTVENATVSTMVEYGEDPDFGAILLYYPVAAGRYTVAELVQ